MRIREPRSDDESVILEIYDEYINSEPIPGIDTFEGVRDFEQLEKMEFEEWLMHLEKNKHKENLPEEYSTQTFYLVENDDGEIVGAICLRWEEVPALMAHGGLIGYSIRPKSRGYGYANEMLQLGLQEYRENNKKIKKLLITCKDFNIPSAKVIEKNGGVYENSCEHDGFRYLRYWIDLR